MTRRDGTMNMANTDMLRDIAASARGDRAGVIQQAWSTVVRVCLTSISKRRRLKMKNTLAF